MKRFGILGVIFIACMFFAGPDPVFGQLIGQQPPQLKASPSFPQPFETVTLSLDAYTYDTTGATIRWFVDGVERSAAQNDRELNITVGDIGQDTTVRAEITLGSGQRLSVSKTLTPSRLDVILEADTYVPPFYKGRALPSSQSRVRAIAVPVSSQNVNDLSFKWTLDREVLYGGPVLGRNVAEFTMPRSDRAFLRVEVADRSGRVLMQSAQYVSVNDVEVHFYEDNALRGLSRTAIQSPHPLVAEEMQVQAEPYYFASTLVGPNTHLKWEVNNQTIENPSSDPLGITLRRASGIGRFTVGLEIRDLENLLQGGENDFTVTF